MRKHCSSEDLKHFLSTYMIVGDSMTDIKLDMTKKFKEFYAHEFMLGLEIRHHAKVRVEVVTYDETSNNTALVCATAYIPLNNDTTL